MVFIKKLITYILSIVIFLSVLKFSFSEKKEYEIIINLSEDKLDYFFIKIDDLNICEKWVPSLINPVLFLTYYKTAIDMREVNSNQYTLNIPAISEGDFDINLYFYTPLDLILARPRFLEDERCFFGLSSKYGDYNDIINDYKILLDLLKNNSKIDKKIFSFKKWIINENSINTGLYLGDEHPNFTTKPIDGIIGSCGLNSTDLYWGCFFKGMLFNNEYTELINDEGESYKVYFYSEDYTIIFPKTFQNQFNKITNYSCSSTEESFYNFGITCQNLFDEKNYTTIKLISDEMNITVEIDNVARFIKKEINSTFTRIKYVENINYFLFPLIMFKQFLIQFDAENNITSFYTNDSSILEVKIDKKKEKEKGSSNGLTVFLVILIIFIILVLGYVIFWFLKKRRNSIEKNINKYNKFEDEEDFRDMNEKRVF